MANVVDTSGNSPVGLSHTDNKLSSVNRSESAVPGVATPGYVGEIVTDETLGVNFRATGTGTGDWVVDNKSL